MDKKWDVRTKPNHIHPRYSENAFESPMKGDVEQDIDLLVECIKKGQLKDKDKRF